MEKLLLLVAITSFLPCLFFTISKITGNLFTGLILKGFSIITIVLDIFIVLRYFNLL